MEASTVERVQHAPGELEDLNLNEEDQMAEQEAEAARVERYAERRAALESLDEDALRAIISDPDTTLDLEVAGGLIDEREATSLVSGDEESFDKVDELRENAGEAVGAMPDPDPLEHEAVAPDALVVSGTAQGSKRKWNGKQPATSVLSLSAAKIELATGTFKKGERVKFSGEMVVVGEASKDKLDRYTKQVTEAVETFNAVVLDFEVE